MNTGMPRRDFLKAAPLAAYALTQIAKGEPVPTSAASPQIKIQPPDGSRVRSLFRPFYTVEENYPYKMYFDKDKLPIGFW